MDAGRAQRTFSPVFILLALVVGMAIGLLAGIAAGPRLKPPVPPHAKPIVKQSGEILYGDNVQVVKVPAGERIHLKVFDLWKGPGDVAPECASAYLRFTWIVREPYPDGREDLALETFIPQGNGQTQVIGSGAAGEATAGYCDDLWLFNSSLQDYRVEMRYASGITVS